MKLVYDLPKEAQGALLLQEGETLRYCVPYDLERIPKSKNPDNMDEEFVRNGYIAVTDKRLAILRGAMIEEEHQLKDLSDIKCEAQVNCGILIAKKNGILLNLLRFSMRHIVRVSYVARGANLLAQGIDRQVVSKEFERYCDNCGRALPGTSECPKCDGKMVNVKKLLQLCGRYKKRLLAISFFMLLSSTHSILQPGIQQRFIDHKLQTGQGTYTDVFIFIGTMLGLLAIAIVGYVMRNWLCVKLGAQISVDLRQQLYHKIQALSLSFVQERKPGELINRITNDTMQIRRFMEDVFGRMFSVLITMVLALGCMLYLNPKLTLISTVLILAVLVITKLFWKKIHRIFRMQWVKDDKLHSELQDVISGMRVVKSFGQEKAEGKKFAELSQDFCRIQRRNEVFWAIFYPILTFLMGVGTYVAIYFGGLDVLGGEMSVGELMQFVAYTGYLYGPLSWMTHLPRGIMQMITSMNRIYDVLDEQPDVADSEDPKEFEIEGAVTFEDMSFGYHSYEPVLEHISMEVKPGEMIGLVGPSGAGKSTVINMIMRLYDADSGRICIDGVDIREIKQECLHSQIGVVLQETFLFSGSILNNIRFARESATLEEVIMAAKAANAHDFICKLPDGYNTYVGEKGYNLSGGERQRIAIARAILNDPKLLILDEATSALDTESEYLIQQALGRLTAGRTTFAIAHRLSTLRNADRLFVIDRHRVAESGTHNELLEKKGIYYGLVNAQLEMATLKTEESETA